MRIDLSKYLTERYLDSVSKQEFEGPVVTISREFGCPGKRIAAELATRLTKLKSPKAKPIDWHWVSKEILAESARELGVDASEIGYVFRYESRNVMDEILSSYSKKYYKSERKIKSTIYRVIRNIARDGNVIIVGRGGVAITRYMEKSFHINLEAPLDWRGVRVSEKFNMSVEEAKKYAMDIDRKRAAFRDYFHGKGSDYSRYDVTFNCMTLSIENITEAIIKLLQLRDLV
jgi:cytidylate kinase